MPRGAGRSARKGDKVILHITNVETSKGTTHGFAIPQFNLQASLEPGGATTIEFVADRAGAYPFYCTEFCSALHMEMQGWLLVQPKPAMAGRTNAMTQTATDRLTIPANERTETWLRRVQWDRMAAAVAAAILLALAMGLPLWK